MSSLKKLIVKLLRETVDKIDADNTELTEEEAIEIMSVLAHRAMSKEQACSTIGYLAMRMLEAKVKSCYS